jgi:hypothetical protein
VARLQILQLPEGAGDERPPFVLVVDQVAPEMVEAIASAERTSAELIGARAIFTFEETVTIPANEPLPLMSVQGDSQTAELIDAHEQTRLALCDAFLLSLDTTWAQIVETAGQRQRSLAGLLRERDVPDPSLVVLVRKTLGIDNLGPAGIPYDEALHNACRQLEKSEASRAHLRSERDSLKTRLQQVQQAPLGPDAMDAGLEHPNVWLHGYRAGVLAAKAAARSRTEAVVAPHGLTKEDVMDVIAQGLDRESRQMRRGTP